MGKKAMETGRSYIWISDGRFPILLFEFPLIALGIWLPLLVLLGETVGLHLIRAVLLQNDRGVASVDPRLFGSGHFVWHNTVNGTFL